MQNIIALTNSTEETALGYYAVVKAGPFKSNHIADGVSKIIMSMVSDDISKETGSDPILEN